jgi:hypothetical protein
MNETLAWSDSMWRPFIDPGSPTAFSYRPSFLQRGSGSAALLAENAQLNRFEALEANWDGRGSLPPCDAAILAAREWLPALYRATTRTAWPWVAPHITPSDAGEVVFEWWKGQRKITLYFGESNVEFIKVWGPNIATQMDSGELHKSEAFRGLWNWLSTR